MASSQSNRLYIPMLGNIALLMTSNIAANTSIGTLPAITLGFRLFKCASISPLNTHRTPFS